jgi:hypothetical protein
MMTPKEKNQYSFHKTKIKSYTIELSASLDALPGKTVGRNDPEFSVCSWMGSGWGVKEQ